MNTTLLRLILIGVSGLSGLTASAQIPWVAETNLRVYCPMRCTSVHTVTQMQMQSTGVGWVQSRTIIGMGSADWADVVITSDEGRTWQSYVGRSPNVIKDFWILPNRTMFGIFQIVGVGGHFEVSKRIAGGNTWVSSFNVAGVEPVAIRFFDDNEGLIVTSMLNVYRTTDQGATWTPASSPPAGAAGSTITPYTSLTLLGNDVWLTSLQGQLWHSSNRGATWGPAINLGLPTTGFGLEVCFSDAQNGLAYVAGAPMLKRTSDGGATWSTVNVTGPRRLRVLAAIPGEPGTYLSGGNAGFPSDQVGLALSTDNGENWRTIDSIYGYDFIQPHSRTQVYALSAQPQYAFLRSTVNILATRGGKPTQMAQAYPNPTTGQLHVPGAAGYAANVFDATGRLCYRASVSATNMLDLSDCQPGLYRIHLLDLKGHIYTHQVAINR